MAKPSPEVGQIIAFDLCFVLYLIAKIVPSGIDGCSQRCIGGSMVKDVGAVVALLAAQTAVGV
jgi:hypothetical protein